jgi:signal transduction histidine kinase
MRTLIASVLVVAALAAALLGWFGAGWSGVEQTQAELRAAPRAEAAERARELAAEVAARLEALRVAEARRPFYHYQNLYHDPSVVSDGLAVEPSPLASGPADELVSAHFQIRAAGKRGWRIDVPTLNDDYPEFNGLNVAADTALRDQLVAIADDLRDAAAGPPVADPTVVAQVEPRPTGNQRPIQQQQVIAKQQMEAPAQQVFELSQEQYTQNVNPNYVLQQAQENRFKNQAQQQVVVPPPEPNAALPAPATAPSAPVSSGPTVTSKPQTPAPRPAARRAAPRVTIAVAPLEWHEAELGANRALVALRRVETPDGELTQGLVIDDDAVARWVAERVPGARLVAEGASTGAAADEASPATALVASATAAVPLAPRRWTIEVPVEGLAAADAAADRVRAQFWGRFLPIAALAMVCGMLVVVVVARAERLARARSQFAAAAAHELRTPLAGLQLYGDMLADGLGDPSKAKQYAHRIAEEASRLGRVVTNVLGFSQLERGDLSVNPRAGDAAEAVRAVVERARPALERAGVALDVTLPDALPARLDPDAVARVLGNLLDNAEKYSRGAAERRVTLAGERKDDGSVELAVSDSGPGVADGARLFVPFSRGVGADGPAGLGLGLALSRSLARAMGGELAHAGGARFVLTLAPA